MENPKKEKKTKGDTFQKTKTNDFGGAKKGQIKPQTNVENISKLRE